VRSELAKSVENSNSCRMNVFRDLESKILGDTEANTGEKSSMNSAERNAYQIVSSLIGFDLKIGDTIDYASKKIRPAAFNHGNSWLLYAKAYLGEPVSSWGTLLLHQDNESIIDAIGFVWRVTKDPIHLYCQNNFESDVVEYFRSKLKGRFIPIETGSLHNFNVPSGFVTIWPAKIDLSVSENMHSLLECVGGWKVIENSNIKLPNSITSDALSRFFLSHIHPV
jgi:hypothetical protein